MMLLDQALKRLVKHGTLTVTESSGRKRSYGTPTSGWPDLGLRLMDAKVPSAIARNPSLGMAEAFMDDRVRIEGGDIMDFVSFIRRNNPWDRGGDLDNPGLLQRIGQRIAFRLDQANQRTASRRNVAHHYDLDDRLYDLFLDPLRQYSCAYWHGGITTLEEAQQAKIEHIAAKMAIRPGMRVLDIGCGWGGLAIEIHRLTGASVHGITLSREQLTYAQAWAAREGLEGKVTFSLTDYRDAEGPFDRIVSVGMFEHVGVPNFGTFFHKCHDLLAKNGVMLLHTIGRAGPPNGTDAFTRKYIFPGGYIPSMSEALAAIEPNKLMVTDVEILRRHYALTLREWYSRCVAQEERIISLYDGRFYRMWLFYLAGAATAFEHADLVNFQFQIVRDRDALPLTRDYIDEAETAFHAARGADGKIVQLGVAARNG
ncbi:cyclopropane-fatty-acyl-phospholipid synthase family protein [Novosphingobium sp. KCTC 2891]|uniref:SAM-dependent methyltransferase n=1 Tax=Novosphingobium sp. KCTC 2891 TaxID=2989730 RepID=UPI002222A7C9|nr:cyclopropane-fatty-acyl-phospholipid synthase family protein [Novosphingobium sp. KCTC 2891]MCW1382900.1 cyclopropane-fatty-acyl-phospholipid synthase family protein [Novosphingobium sp. KCTC 2891]